VVATAFNVFILLMTSPVLNTYDQALRFLDAEPTQEDEHIQALFAVKVRESECASPPSGLTSSRSTTTKLSGSKR